MCMPRISKSLAAKVLLIGIIVVLNLLIPVLQPFGMVIMAVVAVILIVLPDVFEVIKSYASEKKVISRNKQFEKEIADFLGPRFSKPLTMLEPIPERLSRQTVYQRFIERNFPGSDKIQTESLILLTLCFNYRHVGLSDSLGIYSLIQSYSEMLGINRVSNESKPFLAAYYRLLYNPIIVSSIQDLFDMRLPDDVFAKMLELFMNTYSKDAGLAYVRNQLYQSEELRRTLLQMIRRGELSTYGVNEESLTRLQRVIREKGRVGAAYLLLGNKITEDVKQVIKKFPHIGGFIGWTKVPRSKRVPIVGFVIKPPSECESPEEFFRKEIEPHLKTRSKELLLVGIPLDFARTSKLTIPRDTVFASKFMQECFDRITYFTEGYLDDAALWALITGSTIRVNELLSVIPFNIFVPDITPSEREFIIRHYKATKAQLNVKTLEDWKDHNPDSIRRVLLSFGRPRYDKTEAEMLFNIADPAQVSEANIVDRFTRIAEAIVKNSSEFAKSIQ